MIEITFLDSGREPQCPPDPNYPDGRIIDFAGPLGEGKRCAVELPYPAPRCGTMHLHCDECGMTVAVTVAGRVDDPRVVSMPCKPEKKEIN